MSEQDLKDKVIAVICDKLGVKAEQCVEDAAFVDDLGADSLDQVELVMALEDEFEVEIPDEDAEGLTTVKTVLDYVRSKI
jgi:acyl carrier protein